MNYKEYIDRLFAENDNPDEVSAIMAYVAEKGNKRFVDIRQEQIDSAWKILDDAFRALRNKGFFLHCEDRVDYEEDIASVEDVKCSFTLMRYEELD